MSEMENDQTEGWFSQNAENPEFRRGFERERAAEEFLECVESIMHEQGLTRAKLAQMMDCRPANITKVMRHTNNLKLSTMVDVALALGHRLHLSLSRIVEAAKPIEEERAGTESSHEVVTMRLVQPPERHLWLVGQPETTPCQALDSEPLAA